MTTYTISTYYDESWLFHADPTDLRAFGEAVEEAMYVAWELEPENRYTYAQLAASLLEGRSIVFSYHGSERCWLSLNENKFLLTNE